METNKIYNQDCLEYMATLPDGCIDLIVTDPPYGINVVKAKTIGGDKPFGSIRGKGIVKANKYEPIINDDIKIDFTEIFRVSKNQIIFGANYFLLPISKGWIVWDKKLKNDWNDNFSDGELVWTSFDRPLKIYRYLFMGLMKKDKTEKRVHPTQKPVVLMQWIIENYSNPTDIILDPFAGSGSTLVAAERLGRYWIGCDLSEEYCAIARERIHNERNGRLFDPYEEEI